MCGSGPTAKRGSEPSSKPAAKRRPEPATRHSPERTARCDHWSATRHGPEPSSKSGSEPAREHVLVPPPGVAKSSPQGSAHKVSAWDLPHQLRRLIAGAVLAFGFDQGRFLRRQRAVECAGALSYLELATLYSAPKDVSVHVHICSYRRASLQCQPLILRRTIPPAISSPPSSREQPS